MQQEEETKETWRVVRWADEEERGLRRDDEERRKGRDGGER